MGRKSSKKNTTTAVEVINNIQEVEVMGTAVETTAVEVIDSKEEAVMAVETTAIETVAAQAEITTTPEAPATEGPKEMLLFTASRGKNTRFSWNEVTVNPDDPTQKVKGCAIVLPNQVAELIGTDKFVSYIDKDIIARCVEEQKAVRGTASTVSDVYTRYCKVTDTKGDRVKVALEVFSTVLEAIKAGTKSGEWVRPEPATEEAPAEETTALATVTA